VPQLAANTNLDPRLAGPGGVLNLSQAQKTALIAFLKTLSGSAVYTDPKWSNPFEASGALDLATTLRESLATELKVTMFPNPASDKLKVQIATGNYTAKVYDVQGKMMLEVHTTGNFDIDLSQWPAGIYYVELRDRDGAAVTTKKITHL
jgi:cytochrome c peroxidase